MEEQEQLKAALNQAIADFDSRRADILQLAFAAGGQASVRKAGQEYDVLRDAYFEVLTRQLDQSHHRYVELMTAASEETDNLQTAIRRLENINDIINVATSVINLVGRAIIVLGV